MLERLLVIKLAVQGCTAEAWLNGLPVARATPTESEIVVPVHEAALAGTNRLELSIGPDVAVGAMPLLAPHAATAQAHLLLPRVGAPVSENQSRSLAHLAWACSAGEPLQFPTRRELDVDLPLRLPRWRWLDAPLLQPTPALNAQAHAFVTGLARDLARGQTESFMSATRLRTEELALAYSRSPEAEAMRLRERMEQLYASSSLAWRPLDAQDLRLRPLAGGRLLDCLGPEGQAALGTEPDKAGHTLAFPLRVSVVEGRFYVLR